MGTMAPVGLDPAKNVFQAHGVGAKGPSSTAAPSGRLAEVLQGAIVLPGWRGGLRDCAPLGTCDIGARAYSEDDASRPCQSIRQLG
jgi:hypothetical protein